MLLLLSWSIYSQIATKPEGDGTGTNPYQIASLENLYWISANPNEWGKCFIQTEDIDASATSGWFGGTGWVPIGTGSAPFLGFYNGQGHTIDNLFINRLSQQYVGLFGFTGDSFWSKWARIENLGVTNVNFNR